jgi:hypothetical protein
MMMSSLSATGAARIVPERALAAAVGFFDAEGAMP